MKIESRVWILFLALAGVPGWWIGGIAESQSIPDEGWTYEWKDGQTKCGGTQEEQRVAREIVDLDMHEYQAWNNHDMLGAYWCTHAERHGCWGAEP